MSNNDYQVFNDCNHPCKVAYRTEMGCTNLPKSTCTLKYISPMKHEERSKLALEKTHQYCLN